MKLSTVPPLRWIHPLRASGEVPLALSDEDRVDREGVLLFLLLETRLATVEEVVIHRQAHLSGERRTASRDATERAIRDLAAIGVLNLEGRTVYVARAAREAARLVEGPHPEIASL